MRDKAAARRATVGCRLTYRAAPTRVYALNILKTQQTPNDEVLKT